MPIGRVYSPVQPSSIRAPERGRPRARHAAAASLPQNQPNRAANPEEVSDDEPPSPAAAAATSEPTSDLQPATPNPAATATTSKSTDNLEATTPDPAAAAATSKSTDEFEPRSPSPGRARRSLHRRRRSQLSHGCSP